MPSAAIATDEVCSKRLAVRMLMLSSPQSPRFRSIAPLALLGTLILALMWVTPSRAVDGRDFAGFYEVKNVVDLGDTCASHSQ